jgi:hypothetical protein
MVAAQPSIPEEADVRFGSFATFACFWDVRFYSDSDQTADVQKSTLCAMYGRRPRCKRKI